MNELPPRMPQKPGIIGAHQAPEVLGVPAGTVRRWAHEGRLHARGLDRRGRPLYAAAEILALRRPAST